MHHAWRRDFLCFKRNNLDEFVPCQMRLLEHLRSKSGDVLMIGMMDVMHFYKHDVVNPMQLIGNVQGTL